MIPLLLLACGAGAPPPVRVAAASDLRFALEDLLRVHPLPELQPAFGSSGLFYAQVREGAPFDLFLSADADYPERLVEEGAGIPGGLFHYARGRLALCFAAGEPAGGLRALARPGVQPIAVADPDHAPYGRAAVGALQAAGLYRELLPRLVYGENASQAAAFLRAGSAVAGLVPLSLAPGLDGAATCRPLPAGSHPAIDQAGLLLTGSPGAARLRELLLSDQGRRVLARHGFSAPDGRWTSRP